MGAATDSVAPCMLGKPRVGFPARGAPGKSLSVASFHEAKDPAMQISKTWMAGLCFGLIAAANAPANAAPG